MGCLKLTYREELPTLKVVKGFSFSLEKSCAGLYRYGFNGYEKDDEIKSSGNSYTTAFRQYDPRLGRWLSPDPVVKYQESPYAWNTNNPVLFIDEFGADSTQRANAVNQADKFVSKSTKSSSSYGGKGDPGSSTDCSGLVSSCVKAGGEPDPNKGSSNGVTNIAKNSKEVKINDVQEGNLVTFNSNKHIGIISGDIKKDKKGNVISFTVIGSQSSTGPDELTIQTDKSASWTGGNNGYWSPKLGKVYKWDTKPDLKKATSASVQAEANTSTPNSAAQKAQYKEDQSNQSSFWSVIRDTFKSGWGIR